MGACSSSSSSNPAVLASGTAAPSDNNTPNKVQSTAPKTKSSTNGSNEVEDATTNTLRKKEEVKLTASTEGKTVLFVRCCRCIYLTSINIHISYVQNITVTHRHNMMYL